jgi:outer membrane protein TolC
MHIVWYVRVWFVAWVLALLAVPAAATDLIDAWRSAQQHDLDFAVARAAQQSGEARRGQASALWRPSVTLSGTAGVAGSDTAASGAQFSAPGLGTSDGVAFNTSVNRGTLGRWALSAKLPLISRERDAQGKQLALSADMADLEWREAQQTLMLNTAQRYFDVVLAADALRVLHQQQVAVNSALAETQDRFRLGDVPVTDTHEASARSEAITAQGLVLYTGGMRAAREQEALGSIDKARAQAGRTRQQVMQQTRAAWLGLTVGAGRIAALALVSTRARLDATRLGRQVGDRTTLDFLNAENDAASAEFTLMQALVEFLMNRLRLAAAAGRLDEAWLQSVNAALQLLPNLRR